MDQSTQNSIADWITQNKELCVLVVTLAISEIMPFISKIKSNSIAQAVISVVKKAVLKK